MKTVLSRFQVKDILIFYLADEEQHVELLLCPVEKENEIKWDKPGAVDSLVQVACDGDAAGFGFANGHTDRNGAAVMGLHYVSQEQRESEHYKEIITCLRDERGLTLFHTLTWDLGEDGIRIKTTAKNQGSKELVLNMLSSFSLGMLTPFDAMETADQLRIHRIRSRWSAEGRVVTNTIGELQLEPSWANHGISVEKFGQIGSMPVRRYFPFGAIEDTKHGVTWAAELACGSSWQMELYRKDNSLCLSGGIADFAYGHWCKCLKPNEEFETPVAFVTVTCGSMEDACRNLVEMQNRSDIFIANENRLPVVYNEYCMTWGEPSEESIEKAVLVLKEKDVDYFIIDAGWYADAVSGWENNMGDWKVSGKLFPNGMERTVNRIREAGMKPGIWFELEVVGKLADALKYTDHMLKRNGKLIRSGDRMFWDMRDPWTKEYLGRRVIDFLEKYRFAYIKIDYNETIGIGCDGSDSLGQGLYENILATKEFFREIHARIPGIAIELCSSGGHRSEPSFMDITDMVSFSDAHEEPEIPVIAANLHRTMLPEKCQIWCVIRKSDSLQRICYSICGTFMGVLCLSGDVLELTEAQWRQVESGVAFYRKLDALIKNGRTTILGTAQESTRHLHGWQGVLRTSTDGSQAYLVLHTFEKHCEIEVDLDGEYEIESVYESENHEIYTNRKRLCVTMENAYEALAILLAGIPAACSAGKYESAF